MITSFRSNYLTPVSSGNGDRSTHACVLYSQKIRRLTWVIRNALFVVITWNVRLGWNFKHTTGRVIYRHKRTEFKNNFVPFPKRHRHGNTRHDTTRSNSWTRSFKRSDNAIFHVVVVSDRVGNKASTCRKCRQSARLRRRPLPLRIPNDAWMASHSSRFCTTRGRLRSVYFKKKTVNDSYKRDFLSKRGVLVSRVFINTNVRITIETALVLKRVAQLKYTLFPESVYPGSSHDTFDPILLL